MWFELIRIFVFKVLKIKKNTQSLITLSFLNNKIFIISKMIKKFIKT